MNRSKKRNTKSASAAPFFKKPFFKKPFFKNAIAGDRFASLSSGELGSHLDWIENAMAGEIQPSDEVPLEELSLLALTIYWKSRQLRKAIISGRKYVEGVSAHFQGKGSAGRASSHGSNLAYALEILGHAYRETGDPDLARACYQSALEYSPEGATLYCSWATLELSDGNRTAAQSVVERGLRKFGGNVELRLLESDLKRPTLSVCMIVKNEERFLPQCLESIRDLADEIILVDTGSTDSTVSIAESFGCKVFHQEWEGDFSKHRNYSIDQATSDWIFIIDADEVLIEGDAAELKRCLNQDTHPLLSLTVYNIAERSGKRTTFLPSIRIFRRELGLRYEGIVHNRLNHASDTAELRCPVGIKHYGYDLEPAEMARKFARSRQLLEKQLEENPEFSLAHFNLAQLIRAQTQMSNSEAAMAVLSHAKLVIELTEQDSLEFGSIHLMAHHQAATACFALSDYHKGANYCQSALKIKPNYLDALITFGHCNIAAGQLDEAEVQFKRYVLEREKYSEHHETNTLIVASLHALDNAYYNLGKIQEAREKWSAGIEYYNRALSVTEPYRDTLARIGWCHYQLGSRDQAQNAFQKQLENDTQIESAYLGLSKLALDKGDGARAESVLREGIEKASDSRMLRGRLGELLIAENREAESLSLIEDALKQYNKYGPLHMVKGNALNKLARFGEALKAFDTSERLEPGHVLTALGLANAYFSSGDTESSIKWFKVTLERDPHSAIARRNLGLALAKARLFEEAETHLTTYLEVATEDRQICSIMGSLKLELNKGTEALTIFESLLKDDPDDNQALLALSDCYFALGLTDAASLGYQRLLASDPNNKSARERLQAIKTQS